MQRQRVHLRSSFQHLRRCEALHIIVRKTASTLTRRLTATSLNNVIFGRSPEAGNQPAPDALEASSELNLLPITVLASTARTAHHFHRSSVTNDYTERSSGVKGAHVQAYGVVYIQYAVCIPKRAFVSKRMGEAWRGETPSPINFLHLQPTAFGLAARPKRGQASPPATVISPTSVSPDRPQFHLLKATESGVSPFSFELIRHVSAIS